MVTFLLGLFRLIWLFGKGHPAVVLENLALRQQLVIYQLHLKGFSLNLVANTDCIELGEYG
jgi:hypothetical protein